MYKMELEEVKFIQDRVYQDIKLTKTPVKARKDKIEAIRKEAQ
jgi:hypothetical protein